MKYLHALTMVISSLLCIVNVHMPKDRIAMAHQGYGFVEFMSEEDADYAIKIMNMIKLYGKPIRVNKVRPFSRSYCVHLLLCIGTFRLLRT